MNLEKQHALLLISLMTISINLNIQFLEKDGLIDWANEMKIDLNTLNEAYSLVEQDKDLTDIIQKLIRGSL